MRLRSNDSRCAGISLIELVIAVALLALIAVKATVVMRSATDTMSDASARMRVEDQARRVLDRIALTILGSDRSTLLPAVEGDHNASLRYMLSMGVEDGEVVWSDPEEISMQDIAREVLWRQNPGGADERRVVWSSIVRPFLEGELANGVDDNGNGLVDERGLSFLVEGDSVTIRLSLMTTDENGNEVVETVESVVTCRN